MSGFLSGIGKDRAAVGIAPGPVGSVLHVGADALLKLSAVLADVAARIAVPVGGDRHHDACSDHLGRVVVGCAFAVTGGVHGLVVVGAGLQVSGGGASLLRDFQHRVSHRHEAAGVIQRVAFHTAHSGATVQG